MKLWIVVNEFLRTAKFLELEEKFKNAAVKLNVDCSVVTNSDCLITCGSQGILTGVIPCNDDPVLFWDKDIHLAEVLELNGHNVYNNAAAIADCDDKSLTAIRLAGLGIHIPKTIISPMTYNNIGYSNLTFVENAASVLDFPIIVKRVFGSFGAGVFMCNDINELKTVISENSDCRLIYQEYISSSCGKDIRLQVVGDKVVAAMYRYSDDDFRANITNGGKMLPYEPDDAEIELALRAAGKLNLDFAGIDILFGENGPVLCEVNSNAHFKNIDDCTGSDVACDIISYIVSSEKNNIK